MRKILILFTLISLIISACTLPTAAKGLESVFAPSLLSVADCHFDEARALLKDASLYQGQMDQQMIADVPIIPIYPFSWYSSLGEWVATSQESLENRTSLFITLGSSPCYILRMCDANTGAVSIFPWNLLGEDYQGLPPFLQEIQEGSSVQLICGKNRKIEDVMIFSGARDPDVPVFVLYKTDEGDFVRCYRDYTSESEMECSADVFEGILSVYNNYLWNFYNVYYTQTDLLGFFEYAEMKCSDRLIPPKSERSYAEYLGIRKGIVWSGCLFAAVAVVVPIAIVAVKRQRVKKAAPAEV